MFLLVDTVQHIVALYHSEGTQRSFNVEKTSRPVSIGKEHEQLGVPLGDPNQVRISTILLHYKCNYTKEFDLCSLLKEGTFARYFLFVKMPSNKLNSKNSENHGTFR